MITNRVILAGGSGFLGRSLIPHLRRAGYAPVILTRGPSDTTGPVPHVHWDGRTAAGDWPQHLDGAAAIVNVVGRTVDCRKTAANRREILESRVDSVNALAAACALVPNPPKTWVQSATAHIYGDTADEVLDESSSIGRGFAPMVGTAWEKALTGADLPHTRRVILRISFVLGRNGGPFETLSRLTKCFLGGTVGRGRQYISWLHANDLAAIVLRAIDDPAMHGIYVTTAPTPVTNAEFMRELRRALHRPWSPPCPGPLVHLGAFLLRTDPELALLGRRCVPTRLLEEGFAFRFATLPEALKDLTAEPR